MQIHKPSLWRSAVTVPPASEPITLAEVKRHLNIIDNTDDDVFINECIASAVAMIEGATNRAVMAQTRTLALDDFPPSGALGLELPGGVVQSITSIAYTDTNGAAQTLAPSSYQLEAASMRGASAVFLSNVDEAWPSVSESAPWPVVITYVAGWANAAAVPADFKRACRTLAASFYETREAEVAAKMEKSVWWQAFLGLYRLRWIR